MKQKRIKIKGKNIFYYESKDSGQPVVFVHGTSTSSSVFIRQLIDSALSYQFRFIAFDLIGHGKSDMSDNPESDYSMEGLSSFLIEFNNELNIKNAVYVGSDLGANIILESFKDLNKPKGLVLLGATPFSNPISDQVFLKDSIRELFFKSGLDDSEVHQLAHLFVEEDTVYPDFIPDLLRQADIKMRSVLFESIKKRKYKDQIEIVKSIDVPIAVYYGEYDQIIDFSYLNSVDFPGIWRTIIHVIKDSGHLFFYESPADFNLSFEAYLLSVFN